MYIFISDYCYTPSGCSLSCGGQCPYKNASYGPCSSRFKCYWIKEAKKPESGNDSTKTGNDSSSYTALLIIAIIFCIVICVQIAFTIWYCCRIHRRASAAQAADFGKFLPFIFCLQFPLQWIFCLLCFLRFSLFLQFCLKIKSWVSV